jgi:hypothetical protein
VPVEQLGETDAMEYTLRSLSSDELIETLAAHVFARAYRAAWRRRHGEEPFGPHIVAGLDLIIEYVQHTSRSLH